MKEDLDLSLISSNIFKHFDSLGFEFRLFFENDKTEQLILESLQGDSEVDHRSARVDLGGVFRVGQLCCDVEVEALHHVQLLVSHLHLEQGQRFSFKGYIYYMYKKSPA